MRPMMENVEIEETGPAVLMARVISEGIPDSDDATDNYLYMGKSQASTLGLMPENVLIKSRRMHEISNLLLMIWATPEGNPSDWTNQIKSACRISLLSSTSSMAISEEVKTFICEEIPQQDGQMIINHLHLLQKLIINSFSNLVFLSLNLFVSPDFLEEKNICINITLRRGNANSYQEYRNYTRQLLKLFPLEFRRWFLTSKKYI